MPVFRSTMFRHRCQVVLALAGAIGFAQQARATDAVAIDEAPSVQNFDDQRFGGIQGKLHDWDVLIGPVLLYTPRFEGAKGMKLEPLPMISAKFYDRISVGPLGVTVRAYENSGLTLDVKGGLEMGRKEDDDDHLKGLGDVKWGGVFGTTLGYQMGPLEVYASIDKTVGGSDGLTGTLGTKVSHQYDRFLFSLGASMTIADENHMDSYFSVTKNQSVRSGLAAYDAGAGIKRFDVEASAMYFINENWLVRSQVGIGLLTGDAANSPVTQRRVQPSAMLAVGYKF